MTKPIVLIIASVYGLLSVILGAMGAHVLKKILPADKLQSFETGVKYQMYHALVLLVIGLYFSFENNLEKSTAWMFVLGVLFFSFSIYGLSMMEVWKVNLKFLGPITPIGGLLLMLGWAMLIYIFAKRF